MRNLVVVLMLFPKILWGQETDLGVLASFALFTATGAFENFGMSTVTGDIGTDVGVFTGFPDGVVDGATHVVDAVSAQGSMDVNVAYTFLVAETCDEVIGNVMGSGQILTAKTYCIGSLTSLDGELILDGGADPAAVFIIQIDGAFSATALSKVSLINGATANHVYWQINGAVEIGQDAVFVGTIIANGAIELLEGSKLLGRGLSRSGAITLHHNEVVAPIDAFAVLPVELLNFKVVKMNNVLQFFWSTASEINNDYFTLQQSVDASHFDDLQRIQGEGNSNQILEYSIIDQGQQKEGTLYFRLLQTDFDGQFSFSKTISLDFNAASCPIRYYNLSGALLNETNRKNLPTGVYYFQKMQNNTVESGKIFVP